MAKEGSTISGLMDAFATQTSYALQFGVPLKFMVDKFSHMRFEPSGLHQEPGDPDRQVDRRLHLPLDGEPLPAARGRGGGGRDHARAAVRHHAAGDQARPGHRSRRAQGDRGPGHEDQRQWRNGGVQKIAFINTDAPACPDCGAITVRSGSCYKCLNCGATTGCS